jgi:CheY-like chemotaxis protein
VSQPKGRILIIDDDDAVRIAHQRVLEAAGYEVRSAEAPFAGLDATRDWTPDLIMLDLMMPAVSGFEAAKVLKKKPSTRDALLVAFSGMITDDELENFRRIGFDEVIAKPVLPADLVQRIERFLARRRG